MATERMRKALSGIIFLGLVVILFSFLFSPTPDEAGFSLAYQPLVTKTPLQTSPRNPAPFQIDEYSITPLADFAISARVLSTESYWMGREADLSPLDLALGWGRMAEPSVLNNINIRQSSRWYYWTTDQFPIPRREIETHSANMHMIPANDDIKAQLKAVDKNQVITLAGSLVRADTADGWKWISSLTREDTGNRACELFYVTDVRVH